MRDKLKRTIIATMAIVLTLHLGGLLGEPLMAQTMWVEGTVTTAPWLDRYHRIGVNGVTYTFMPEIGISFPNKSRPKVSGEKLTSLLQIIQTDQKVKMRVQGHRIYEIIIF